MIVLFRTMTAPNGPPLFARIFSIASATRKPEPIEWDETTATAASEATPVEEEASTLTAY
jgi:hypothetical protein